MSQLAIDPIGYSEALQKAGMPKEQADLIAKTQEARLEKMIELNKLATKADIARVEKLIAETAVNQAKDFHNTLYGFAGVIIAAVAVAVAAAVAILK